MAMTLRLTEEQDRQLSRLADTLGTSKQEAVVRAITEAAARRRLDEARDALSAVGRERYATLLERLGS